MEVLLNFSKSLSKGDVLFLNLCCLNVTETDKSMICCLCTDMFN